jgi:trehalose 6-phosphate synthase/phosphatase
MQDLFPRRGSSALYDAIRNLSSDAAPWETTFVGWTGEIHELPPIKPARSNPTGGSKSSGQFPISASYAPQMTRTKSYHVPPPVPLIKHDGNRMTMTADYGTQEDEEIKIFKDDRDELEGLLSEKGKAAGWGDVVPVWIGGDEDGKMSIGGVDRWRNYAERGMLDMSEGRGFNTNTTTNFYDSYLAAIPLYRPTRLLPS